MKLAHVILALLVLSLAGAALADNLLLNADFETGDLSEWLVFGETDISNVVVQAGDNGLALPGDHSALMTNTNEAMALLLKQSTPAGTGIAGGVDYAFDLKLIQADNGGVVFVNMFAEQEDGGVIGGSGLLGPFFPWGDWETFSGSFVAPVGTDFLTIQIEAVTGATIGSNCIVQVDNVIMDQGTVGNEALSFSSVKNLYR